MNRISISKKTIQRWRREKDPRVSAKNLAATYAVIISAKNKEDFLERCPESILTEVLKYGQHFLDEIKFTKFTVDRELFQEYFETDYIFRRVFYYLMAVNKTNKASGSLLNYKFGAEANTAMAKMVNAGFAQIEEGKITLTDVFLGSIFDVRRIRSMITKLVEEFATDEQFEEANRSTMLFRIFGVNKKGHERLMTAASEYMRAVNDVFLDEDCEGPIAVASTQSMIVLENPLENSRQGGVEQ